jgi:hypothetical protein
MGQRGLGVARIGGGKDIPGGDNQTRSDGRSTDHTLQIHPTPESPVPFHLVGHPGIGANPSVLWVPSCGVSPADQTR